MQNHRAQARFDHLVWVTDVDRRSPEGRRTVVGTDDARRIIV